MNGLYEYYSCPDIPDPEPDYICDECGKEVYKDAYSLYACQIDGNMLCDDCYMEAKRNCHALH